MEIKIMAKIKGDAGIYRVRSLDGEMLRMLVERNCGTEWVDNKKIQFIEIVQEENGKATATMDNVKCSFRQVETLVILRQLVQELQDIKKQYNNIIESGSEDTSRLRFLMTCIEIKNGEIARKLTELIGAI